MPIDIVKKQTVSNFDFLQDQQATMAKQRSLSNKHVCGTEADLTGEQLGLRTGHTLLDNHGELTFPLASEKSHSSGQHIKNDDETAHTSFLQSCGITIFR